MSLLHQIALTQIPGVGHTNARNLMSYCGSAEEIFSAKFNVLNSIPGIGPKTAASICNHAGFDRAEAEMEFIEKYKIKPLFITDKDYPQRLKNCGDAPVILYFKGETDLNAAKVISIVGTRNATDYGKELCRQLVEDLQPHHPLIISGLAYGIDSMAHNECLKNQIHTVGILGHGLDRIYPALNRNLAGKMLECGGLLTEFPSKTNPDRENFPKRNRIIAGISDVTIVVEANIKGGALITAEIANSYNRDVFAFPGRVQDEYSSGCNYLIKTNRANLISGVKDLEYLLGWSEIHAKKQKPQLSLLLNLSAAEQKIVDVLKTRDLVEVDELAIKTNLQQSKLAVSILGLEMQGIIIALPGKVYKLA
ncbi:DNA-processing protein DprA [Daejeonella oryzae]|uniref:DNA-processing protein DprA n=1 Tax=Daejeonella oryzae TaxID=1122943 RepID=UPI0003F6FC1D|nr:DNA-processing protein DprA [Daejeonella oryzae]